MPSQTVIWTALPNGIAGDGVERRLRLSVHVSPRLRAGVGEDHTLAAFPDFQDWPSRMLAATFQVAFAGGPSLAAALVGPLLPESSVWTALFKPDTSVRPYVFDDHAQRQIVSYPVRHVVESLRRRYSRIALESAERLPIGQALLGALDDFALDWNPDTEAMARDSLGRGQDISTREALARLLLFHHPPELRAEDARLPTTDEDFHSLFDFHEAVSSLGDYPSVLRTLGLVLDLEVRIGDLAAGALPATGGVQVRPTWAAQGPPPLNSSPFTVYRLDATHFEATPQSEPIVDGVLTLEPGRYGLVQVDVDGAAIKANNTALNLQRSGADTPDEAGLPALRSGGISLVRYGRAEQTSQHLTRATGLNGALEADPPSPPRLFAEDLVRGYRIDVWDSQTGVWHSLCRRIGTYRFIEAAIERTYEDEGWVQMGATVAPAPGKPPSADDLYLHESLMRWEGWSLVAQRPGKALSRHADPAAPPEAPVSDPRTPFKLVTAFQVPARSLPRLRFGTEYRVRARVVDLAGNGPSFATPAMSGAVPSNGTGFAYLRFDPVAPPTVVLRSGLSMSTTPGESLERLVVRSFNATDSEDGVPTPFVSERHIAPPRSSQLMAEVHGKFDRPGGGLQVDPVTYATIRDKDAGQLQLAPLDPLNPAAQAVPVEPDARLKLPYLPDFLARGAALRNLPALPEGSVSRLAGVGVLVTEMLPGPEIRPGSVLQIDFGAPESWPEALPFRLVLSEGNAPPAWDAIGRVLAVHLPKASMTPVQLSSYLNSSDLTLMGVWEWMREEVDERARANAMDPKSLEDLDRLLGRVVQRTLEGGHWMITPWRTVTLVHAVQQPLGRPRFGSLSAFRQHVGATAAGLIGVLGIHGRSTSKVDITATWREPIDALDEPGPREIEGSATADEIPLVDLSSSVIRVTGRPQPLGLYEPVRDEVTFNIDAHPRHEFGDTKHRMVHYRPVSTSRFREYFPPDVSHGFTRTGEDILVDVPSSARPAAPNVLYVLPTFGWQRQANTNLIASRRSGGLRVYIERGWFSSGADELLGVVYTTDLRPSTPRPERERLSQFVTQWGFDPIHNSRPGTPELRPDHFPDAVQHGFGLTLPELPGVTLSTAAYRPAFAADRGLWYCDITLNAGESYYPFVKLALARYQPRSMPGVELSRVVLATIAQIAPDRSVIVTYDPYDPDMVHVVVAGFTYVQPLEGLRAEIEVSGQRQYDAARGELGWGFAPGVVVSSSTRSDSDRLLWHGQVRLPPGRTPGEYRVMVKEYERHTADGPAGVPTQVVRRLVYAEALVV